LIQTSANAGAKTWTFGNTGNLTFPDSTVQSTAWTGTVYTNEIPDLYTVLDNFATLSYVTGLGYTTTATVNTLIANSLSNYTTSTLVAGTFTAVLSSTGTLSLNTLTATGAITASKFISTTGILQGPPGYGTITIGSGGTVYISALSLNGAGTITGPGGYSSITIGSNTYGGGGNVYFASTVTVASNLFVGPWAVSTATGVSSTSTSSLINGSYTVSLASNGDLMVPASQYGTGQVFAPNLTTLCLGNSTHFVQVRGSDGALILPDSTVQTTAWTGVVGALTSGSYTASLSSSTGVLTATAFSGDGSRLTNLSYTATNNIVGTQTNVVLIAGSNNYTWTFDQNGNVTAPVPTTATVVTSMGYIGLPQTSTNTNYTVQITDMGKHVYVTATSTVTIPANSVTPFPVGSVVTFVAGPSTTATIAITTDTLYLAGSGSTGTRTLAAYGMATAVKLTTSTWFINGTGLS
jgi:hypothetical protein